MSPARSCKQLGARATCVMAGSLISLLCSVGISSVVLEQPTCTWRGSAAVKLSLLVPGRERHPVPGRIVRVCHYPWVCWVLFCLMEKCCEAQ
jgi:hypothetical protein